MLVGFIKSIPKTPLWYFTRNIEFIGNPRLNIVCYLNQDHILFSSGKVSRLLAYDQIPEDIKNAFDDNEKAINSSLVVVTELNETCEKVIKGVPLEDQKDNPYVVDVTKVLNGFFISK